MQQTRIKIHAKQLIDNINNIKQYVNHQSNNNLDDNINIKFCFPVKANAYGHGLTTVSTHVANDVDYFAVSSVIEGHALRNNHINNPILVFGGLVANDIKTAVAYNLEITISSMYKAELVANYCNENHVTCKVHIKIDTGMHRVGVRPITATTLIDYVLSKRQLELIGVYSHLVQSEIIDDELTKTQIAAFKIIADHVKTINNNIICHIANSGAVNNYSNAYFDMIRPGILTYGYNLSSNNNIMVKPCLSLLSTITYFKVLAANSGISYNYNYKTKQQARVVTIPIGYGDGYRRSLSNCGEVIIRHHKYIISGNICMDMLMVDIGDNEAYIGDTVILIGSDGVNIITALDIANKCHTIVYEILCNLSDRILRTLV